MAPKRRGGITKRVERRTPPPPKRSRAVSVDTPQLAISSHARPLSERIRKRVAASVVGSTDEPQHNDGPLVNTMKKKWGRGKVSAKDVAEIFDGATKQGASGLPRMSSLDHPQNLHRSLVAACGQPAGVSAFFWAWIPMLSGKVLHPFLLPPPHVLFFTIREYGIMVGKINTWSNRCGERILGQYPSY